MSFVRRDSIGLYRALASPQLNTGTLIASQVFSSKTQYPTSQLFFFFAELAQIPTDTIQNLVESFPRGVEAPIAAQGVNSMSVPMVSEWAHIGVQRTSALQYFTHTLVIVFVKLYNTNV